jgi:hypothetical protein
METSVVAFYTFLTIVSWGDETAPSIGHHNPLFLQAWSPMNTFHIEKERLFLFSIPYIYYYFLWNRILKNGHSNLHIS